MADCQLLFTEAALNHSYCLSQCRFFVSTAADDLYLVAAFDASSDDVHQALSVDVFAVDLECDVTGILSQSVGEG